MLIVPKTHGAHLARSAPPDLVAVGHALRTALDRLRHCVDDPPPPPQRGVPHRAPPRCRRPVPWHVHVLPRVTSVAGFEQGTGVMTNIVPPELAAQQLNGCAEPVAAEVGARRD